jgi:hypothetical protein
MDKRRCFQYELDGKFVKEFESSEHAARELNLNGSHIRKCLRGERNTHGGFIWKDKKILIEYKYKLLDFNTESVKIPALTSKIKDIVGKNKQENLPKILLLDVETAPIRAFVWQLWKQDISLPQLISDFYILTWSAKWLEGKTIFSERLTGTEAVYEDDERIIRKLWAVIDDADIIIAHNGDNFDLMKINTRFVIHKLPPPSSYKTIDTLKVAKNIFGFSSNKLQHLANSFGIEGKYDTDFELWIKCLEGDEKSLKYMQSYNQHDIEILEQVYLRLRPYIKGHANINLYSEEEYSCPHCGSTQLKPEVNKFFYTQAVKYQLYRCQDCGAISRAKQSDKFLIKKRISAIPR